MNSDIADFFLIWGSYHHNETWMCTIAFYSAFHLKIHKRNHVCVDFDLHDFYLNFKLIKIIIYEATIHSS